DLPLVLREHPVLIVGELGELVDVVPDPLVRRVEQVRTVTVDLDAGLRLRFRVRVAADVVPSLQHQHPLVELAGDTFGHRQAEETGTDDNQIETGVCVVCYVCGVRVRAHGRKATHAHRPS